MNNYSYLFFYAWGKRTKKACKDIPQNTFAGYCFRYILCILRARRHEHYLYVALVCVCVCVSKLFETHKYKTLKDVNAVIFVHAAPATSLHLAHRAHSAAWQSPILRIFIGR